jgi:hypothetical protein
MPEVRASLGSGCRPVPALQHEQGFVVAPAWGRRDGVMSKEKPKHEITYNDVQAVLMKLQDTRKVVEAVLQEQPSATVQVILVWTIARIRDAERLTLIARSGPNIIEDLRKEGHDV